MVGEGEGQLSRQHALGAYSKPTQPAWMAGLLSIFRVACKSKFFVKRVVSENCQLSPTHVRPNQVSGGNFPPTFEMGWQGRLCSKNENCKFIKKGVDHQQSQKKSNTIWRHRRYVHTCFWKASEAVVQSSERVFAGYPRLMATEASTPSLKNLQFVFCMFPNRNVSKSD